MNAIDPVFFQTRLLRWFNQYGRHGLPWQQHISPYRVWISEIMLQQTQVQTVIPYFHRFISRFENVQSLANAEQDELLHYWAGLGYYRRAHYIHKSAKIIAECYQGHFPDSLSELIKLPGVGRSTAGAILSLGFNQPGVILDGNVKRVLARYLGIDHPINDKKTENQLWEIALSLSPKAHCRDYSQAVMDLGATVCTQKQTACNKCPLHIRCYANMHDLTGILPIRKAQSPRPTRIATFLVCKIDDFILLKKRKSKGVWQGLFCLPELQGKPCKKLINDFLKKNLKKYSRFRTLPIFKHSFTHYHLELHPILLGFDSKPRIKIENSDQIWYNLQKPQTIGLPKPIQQIIRALI